MSFSRADNRPTMFFILLRRRTTNLNCFTLHLLVHSEKLGPIRCFWDLEECDASDAGHDDNMAVNVL